MILQTSNGNTTNSYMLLVHCDFFNSFCSNNILYTRFMINTCIYIVCSYIEGYACIYMQLNDMSYERNYIAVHANKLT